jgi:fatty acid desaturase
MQSYSPFRTSLLTWEQIQGLSVLRPFVPIRDTLIHWLFIIAAWTAAALSPYPGVIALAVTVVGINFYGLYIIGHDGLHRRLFESLARNDFWNDVFILGSFGAITRLNRRNHMAHHQDTSLDCDPDRHKYVHAGKEPILPFTTFLLGATNLLPSVRNVFFHDGRPTPTIAGESYRARDIVILLAWQMALILGLSLTIGWWAYPILWLLPVYMFGYRADLTRVFCEHSVLTSDSEADRSFRLISYQSNWFERLFFAPHNMNFHAAHHLWPGIPYYRLPAAERLMRAASGDPRLVWRQSYTRYLIEYFRWRRRHSEPVPLEFLR